MWKLKQLLYKKNKKRRLAFSCIILRLRIGNSNYGVALFINANAFRSERDSESWRNFSLTEKCGITDVPVYFLIEQKSFVGFCRIFFFFSILIWIGELFIKIFILCRWKKSIQIRGINMVNRIRALKTLFFCFIPAILNI